MLQSIELLDYQVEHFNRLAEIFSRSIYAIDTSTMRRGKSFVAHKLFQELQFPHCIVICPATVESVWKNIQATYGPEYVNISSYESWRSVKGNQPKHGLLYRKEDETFEVTEQFNTLIKEGVLFICDEFQKIKNKSDQYYAIKAVVKAINAVGGMNRMLFLSGTPIDKEEQAINLVELLGIVNNSKMFKYHSREERLELLGAKELYEYCNKIDREKTKEILSKYPFSQKNVIYICYLLYIYIINPSISSAMPQEESEKDTKLDVKNLYVNLSPDQQHQYNNIVNNIGKDTNYNPKTGKVSIKNFNWNNFTTYLVNLENIMVYSYVRKAIEELESDPNCKVILSFNYNNSIRLAYDNLLRYNPLIINGSVSKNDRAHIIQNFQKSDLEYRLIITNLKVISLGISLEDKNGNFPRKAYGSPNYSAMDMLQWVSRFHSKDTKGDQPVKVRFLYGKSEQPLTSILKSIFKKSKVFKEILTMQVNNGLKFQDDYDNEEEINIQKFDIPFINNPIETPENIDYLELEE